MPRSNTAIAAPSTTETATTETDCFKSESLSGHTIFLNSDFIALKKLFFGALSAVLLVTSPMFHFPFCWIQAGVCSLPAVSGVFCQLIWSPYAGYEPYRIYNTFSFPFCPDAASFLSWYCNSAAYIRYMPM